MAGIIVKCECGYEGIRWNDNLICKRCGGLMKIIAKELKDKKLNYKEKK